MKKAPRRKKTSPASATSRKLRVTNPPAWKFFEQAVAAFIRTIDPNATILENFGLPDVDTGRPRQRDVVVKAIVCQQFPVTILVSCKLKRRPLKRTGY